MSDYVRNHLGAKILLSYLIVIAVGVVVLVIASQFILPSAFNQHMQAMMGNGGMTLAPDASAGVGQGNGFGGINLYRDFRAGFNEALLYAMLAATLVAVLVGVFFSQRVIAPLREMMNASQRI